ncbi:MAG: hypothetical protein D8M59_06830 [Planctomycetes bacterium]|nr:hypothetical protein [Planctomycetota bacterium]NOG54381.1 potassium channel protein [Planctomycetota bacterium]
MPIAHLDHLNLPLDRRHRFVASRIWREWCFARVVGRHFRVRLLLMIAILTIGAFVFQYFEPERHHSVPESIYFAWSLIFGEPPEEFPDSPVVQVMFFLLPVLGLTVIIEGIIDFSLILRDRRRSERSWCTTMSAAYRDHIVLVGIGRLGYQTFRMLRRLGQAVVVIERDPANEFLEDVRRDGSPLFVGDARREALLEDANVAHARSLILATDDDLANLEIALDARKLSPTIRVVLRMFDQNMANKVADGFNIHIAISQSTLSAPMFAMSAVDHDIIHSFVAGNELIIAKRWTVQAGGPLCGRSVGQIMTDHRICVIERRVHPDPLQELFPPPDTTLEAGDSVVIQGPYGDFTRLSHILDPQHSH